MDEEYKKLLDARDNALKTTKSRLSREFVAADKAVKEYEAKNKPQQKANAPMDLRNNNQKEQSSAWERFYDNLAYNFINTTSPAAEGYRKQAQLQDQYAAQQDARAAQNQQIVNRDVRQEATKDATAKATATNEQKVANLGSAAGVGAAALARETVTPDIQTLRNRQDEQRREAVKNAQEAYNAREGAIRRRARAAEQDQYDYIYNTINDKSADLSKGKGVSTSTQEINNYFNKYINGDIKLEDMPTEVQDKVKQQVVLTVIDLQNAINQLSNSKLRYKLEGNSISYYTITNEDPTASRNNEVISEYKAKYGDSFTTAMNRIRYDAFDKASGGETQTANNPKQTAELLTKYLNNSTTLNQNVINGVTQGGF